MKRPKITIVGAGSLGTAVAQWAVARELADLVLVDAVEGLAQGRALDLQQAAAVDGLDLRISGTTSFDESADSRVVIIAAGQPRQPGMTRDELLENNVRIVAEAALQAASLSPEAVLIIATSPVEATTYAASRVSNFPPPRVVGQSGALDAARLRSFIAEETGYSVREVQAMLLGSQGDELIPLSRYISVAGIPVTQLIAPGRLEEIITRTRNGSAEIVNLLKTGTPCFAPAAAIVAMVDAILHDRKRLLPCTAYCQEEYGAGGYFIGVPCLLGAGGIEKIVEVELDQREKELFAAAVEHTRQLCEAAKRFLPRTRKAK